MTAGLPARVFVTVPSFRRPDRLARLLEALREQRESVHDVEVTVVVIDNDPDGSAQRVAEEADASYALEPAPGLAAVRNRALDEALSAGVDALVFIDDDEIPTEGWLRELLAPWREERADLVSGKVVSTFDPAPDPWIEAGGFFRRRQFADGELMLAAPTNNLLIDVQTIRRTAHRFDEAFGVTGGEDIHFTAGLARGGARIISAPKAVVLDPVPPARATREWVLRRAYRVGTTTVAGDVALQTKSTHRVVRRLRWAVHGLARTVVGLGRWLWGKAVRSLVHQARGARLTARGIGMVAGAVGVRYYEYRTPSQKAN